jgi:uncharacterized protein
MLAQALLLAPVVAMAIPAPSATSAIDTERNRQAVTAAFDRWQAGGTDFFDEILSPDVVWTIQGSGPSAGTFRNRRDLMARAVRPLTIRLATPIRPTFKRIWADGDHVIIDWKGEAVARDGRPYRNDYVWIFRMSGGKAVEVKAMLDLVPYDDVIRRIPAPAAETADD